MLEQHISVGQGHETAQQCAKLLLYYLISLLQPFPDSLLIAYDGPKATARDKKEEKF